jgi:hypothetical protein
MQSFRTLLLSGEESVFFDGGKLMRALKKQTADPSQKRFGMTYLRVPILASISEQNWPKQRANTAVCNSHCSKNCHS